MRFEIKKRFRIAERTAISVARPFSKETDISADDLATLVESDAAKERIFATVDFAQLPTANDLFVRVFVNLPAADVDTPTDDPHYAGSFAFFGTHSSGHEGHGKTDFLVNVTDTLQRLKERGEMISGSTLSVQLVPVPVTGEFLQPEAELILESIDLVVSPVLIRSKES